MRRTICRSRSNSCKRRKNDRIDEYGGSLENRARLLRELIEDTKDAVGDKCAVAVRFAADELIGDAGLTHDGEARDVVEMLAELPDLWDINLSNWPNDSQTSRFAKEGFQEEYTSFVKQVTSKPVVGVGRFTSPDTMVSQIRRGILDFIGAARPSIADPFLPKKIEEGRIDEIRECIGCNICVSSDYTSTNLRCTQNPTMGEEWRRGWHPEIIPPKKSEGSVLVVGAGPAGLEAALSAARRGYEVHLAEAGVRTGRPGQPRKPASGPVGMGARARLARRPSWSGWRTSRSIATARSRPSMCWNLARAMWRSPPARLAARRRRARFRISRSWVRRSGVSSRPTISCPVAIPAEGPVIVWDDDHYYMGGVLAELCRCRRS